MTTDVTAVRKAKSEALTAAKKRGVTIDFRATGRTWAADVIAPEGKMFDGGSRSFVTHYYTKPDAEFWQMVLRDVNTPEQIIDIDYDEYPEYDDRDI